MQFACGYLRDISANELVLKTRARSHTQTRECTDAQYYQCIGSVGAAYVSPAKVALLSFYHTTRVRVVFAFVALFRRLVARKVDIIAARGQHLNAVVALLQTLVAA